MSNDRDDAIKRGQAYNLAIATACAAGKQDDNKYIMLQFIRHLEFSKLLQKCNLDELNIALDNPIFVEKIKELDKDLNK